MPISMVNLFIPEQVLKIIILLKQSIPIKLPLKCQLETWGLIKMNAIFHATKYDCRTICIKM